MALTRPRQTIPIHIEWTDSDSYADDAAFPMHAALGRQIVWRDRILAGHCLRGIGEAFPQAQGTGHDMPEVSHYGGIQLGPWPFHCSSVSGRGEFYLRAKLANGIDATVQPWVSHPARVDPPRGPSGDSAQTITGTGSMATYGPFEVPLVPGEDVEVGITVWPRTDGVAVQTGVVLALENKSTIITDAAGAALWGAWGNPEHHQIRLKDTASGDIVHGWRGVVGVRTTTVADDTLDFWPELGWDHWVAAPGLWTWETYEAATVTLGGVYFWEQTLTGDLSEARYA